MQIDKKKIFVGIGALICVVILLVVFILKNKSTKEDYLYTYTFINDDNLISQTVTIYDNNENIQTDYYIVSGDDVLAYTNSEKCVLTIAKMDLSKHKDIEISFASDINKRYKVKYSK